MIDQDTAFRAIGDSTRRQILDLLLSEGPLRATDIAARFPQMTRPAVSKHLRVLREASLVQVQDGSDQREWQYSLNPAPLYAMHRWLGRYERFWRGRLDALKRLVEEQE